MWKICFLVTLLFSIHVYSADVCESSKDDLWATTQEYKNGNASKSDFDRTLEAYRYCVANKSLIEAQNKKKQCESLKADLWATTQEYKAGIASKKDYESTTKRYRAECAKDKREQAGVAGCEGGQLSHDSTRITCPDGKVYKIDNSVNASSRKKILKMAAPQDSPEEGQSNSSRTASE